MQLLGNGAAFLCLILAYSTDLVLAGSSGTNGDYSPFDVIDQQTEKKHQPASVPGWIYTGMAPIFGAVLVSLSFPLLWFNERRASRLPKAPASGAPGSGGAPASEKDTESQAMLSSSDPLQAQVDALDERVCGWCLCSARLRTCFDGMPELNGMGDARTQFFRVLGFFMLFGGMDMILSPVYFMLSCLWFMGALIAGHLALCICKLSCTGYWGTLCGSYAVHRPLAVAAGLAAIVLCAAGTMYLKTNFL
eukprot:TRINITY_DN26863_c0_g1_i2.p1 TRINITY_DN26863_c0_g1~~TRINITY_DN26863_c0_g1_i2.p1  ORF type:complete len:249 (+),score=31.43 TRINITY_DN26863_c0_g1_i2:48-794(+)